MSRVKYAKYIVVPKRVSVNNQRVVIWKLKQPHNFYIYFVSENREDVINYWKEKINHFSILTSLAVANSEGDFIRYIWSSVDDHSNVDFKERLIDEDFKHETKPVVAYTITQKRAVHKSLGVQDNFWVVKKIGSPVKAHVAETRLAAIEFYARTTRHLKRPSIAYIYAGEKFVEQIVLSQIINGALVYSTQFIGRASKQDYYILSEWTKNDKGLTERLWGIKVPGHSSYLYASPNKTDVERYFRMDLDHSKTPGVAYVYNNEGQFEKIIRARQNIMNALDVTFDEQMILDKDEVTRETVLNTSTKSIKVIVFIGFIAILEILLLLGMHLGKFI